MPKNLPSNELLVLDFGQGTIRVVLMDLSSGSPRIADFAVLPRERDPREDEERARIRKAMESLSPRGKPPVVMTWEDGIVFRQLTLPIMPEEDLKKAFLWEMQQKFTAGSEDNALAYETVAEGDSPEGTRERLYSVFHADRKTLADRVAFVEGAGYTVQAVLPAQAALARLSVGAPEVRDTLLFDIGLKTARILVVRRGKNMLSRTVLLGGRVLTDLLAGYQPGGGLAIGPAEADELKVRQGAANPQAEHISLLRPYLEKIVAEIKRSIDYYELQKYSQPIGSVLFTGGGSDLKGLEAFMSRFLGLDVRTFDREAFLSPKLSKEKRALAEAGIGGFATALGAAIGAEEAVSLLPRLRKSPGKVRAQKTSARLAAVFVCACLILLDVGAFLTLRASRSALKTAELEWGEIARIHKLLEEIKTQQSFLRTALKGDLSHPALLKELSLATPETVRLDELSFNRTDASLTLRGTVLGAGKNDVKVIAQFIGDLMKSPFFTDAALVSAVQDAAGDSRFELRCATKGIS
ncbi:MAG TPA: pilus assembly protein PilM [Candidatus Eisenbacteria bacterium]|nr:pilus assembly protein PilM [Candidatus Eisenbacteria bacterium]